MCAMYFANAVWSCTALVVMQSLNWYLLAANASTTGRAPTPPAITAKLFYEAAPITADAVHKLPTFCWSETSLLLAMSFT